MYAVDPQALHLRRERLLHRRGRHLVADSDIVIASERAQFFDTHVNIGLINGVEAAGFAFKMPLGIVMRMAIEGKHYRSTRNRPSSGGLFPTG